MTSPWRRLTLLAWAISRAVLLVNIVVLHHPCDYVFWLYGHRTVALHEIPYRDFSVEYPPLATLLFMLPGGAPSYGVYAGGFALIMGAADAATLWLVRYAATRLGSWRDGWGAACVYVVSSALIGAILPKFDLLPGSLSLLAVLLLVSGRARGAWIALAASVLFKGYAIVLVPLFIIYYYRTRGWVGWWRGPLSGLLFTAVVVGPFLILAGRRLIQGPLYHAQRGLEIESIYASVVLVAHHLAGLTVAVSPQRETISRDVFSPLNGPLLSSLPLVLGMGLGATYIVAWIRLRHDPSPQALLTVSMAAVTAFMISFKALPTHYLLWVCPLAAVACGDRHLSRATSAFWIAAALGAAIPQVWVPLRVLALPAVTLMVARNVAIVAVFVLLLQAAWPSGYGHHTHMPHAKRRHAVGRHRVAPV